MTDFLTFSPEDLYEPLPEGEMDGKNQEIIEFTAIRVNTLLTILTCMQYNP